MSTEPINHAIIPSKFHTAGSAPSPGLVEEKFTEPLIFKKIPLIMGELNAIPRDTKGANINYKYRGIDDLYNALQPLMSKHGVFTVPQIVSDAMVARESKSGSALYFTKLRVRYRFYATDGSYFDAEVMGEAMDSGDKGCNKAESIAHKYALTQVFVVRTEDQSHEDPDSTKPEDTLKKNPKPIAGTGPSPAGTGRPTSSEGPLPLKATQKQLALMFVLAEEVGVTEEFLKNSINKKWKLDSFKDLSSKQASDIISWLQEEQVDRSENTEPNSFDDPS